MDGLLPKVKWLWWGCGHGVCCEFEEGKWWEKHNRGEGTGDYFEWSGSKFSHMNPKREEVGQGW